MVKVFIAVLLMSVSAASGADGERSGKHSKKQIALLVGTIAYDAVGTFLDMKSSLACDGRAGLSESNALFRSGSDNGFHARGASIMWLITGAAAGAEYLAWRKGSVWQSVPEVLNVTAGTEHIFAGYLHNRKVLARLQGK